MIKVTMPIKMFEEMMDRDAPVIISKDKPEFSEEFKQTYYPYWEEMKQHIAFKHDGNMAKIEATLAKAHLNALEVGFNTGWKQSLDQLMHLIERSAFSLEVKETMRQMVEIQKKKV